MPSENRLSLKPLSEEDALRGLLETKPPPKPPREPKPRQRKPKQEKE